MVATLKSTDPELDRCPRCGERLSDLPTNLVKIAQRDAEIERLRAALKPFEELARVVLAEAPADAGYVSLFVDSAGRSHRITLDQLRATYQQQPRPEKK